MGKNGKAVICVSTREATLKKRLRRHLKSLGFSSLIKYFASGKDIDVARLSPVLQRISSDTWESELFRLAALTWSVPVSKRRPG
jgi:hypothetical protein